jgi:hypothetical protein
MIAKLPFIVAAVAASVIGPLHAQNPPEGSTGSARFTYWRAILPGGVYVVPHSKIASIGKSSYLVDGVVRVTEVSIDTDGSVQGRFYHAAPVEPKSPVGIGDSVLPLVQERAKEITTRTGTSDVWSAVLKNYPTSTHAHTIEFRLDSLETLNKLYESLERSFLRLSTDEFRAN